VYNFDTLQRRFLLPQSIRVLAEYSNPILNESQPYYILLSESVPTSINDECVGLIRRHGGARQRLRGGERDDMSIKTDP